MEGLNICIKFVLWEIKKLASIKGRLLFRDECILVLLLYLFNYMMVFFASEQWP